MREQAQHGTRGEEKTYHFKQLQILLRDTIPHFITLLLFQQVVMRHHLVRVIVEMLHQFNSNLLLLLNRVFQMLFKELSFFFLQKLTTEHKQERF